MAEKLGAEAFSQLFSDAHTANAWQPRAVEDATLTELVDLMKMGPTSANCLPARLVFVKSAAAKARLEPFLSENNRAKTMAAPVTAIVAYDLEFYEHLPRLFPHNQTARSWFAGNDENIRTTALRNGSLQAGYMIMAARALGLGCGPMSGFDNAGVDSAFFPDGKVRSNLLCNLGYADPKGYRPRGPRFAFDEMAKIV